MITIRHPHEDGTVLEGSAKGDGGYDIVKRHGFRYFPSIGAIGIRGSRDQVAKRWLITPPPRRWRPPDDRGGAGSWLSSQS